MVILLVVAVNAGFFLWWWYSQPSDLDSRLAIEGEVKRRLAPRVYVEEFDAPIDPQRNARQYQEAYQKAEEIINFKVELPVWLPEGLKLKKIEAVGAKYGKKETALGDIRVEYIDTLGGMTVEYASQERDLKIFQGRSDIGEFEGGKEITLKNGRSATVLSQAGDSPMRVLYYSDENQLLFFVFWSSQLSEDELVAVANSIE